MPLSQTHENSAVLKRIAASPIRSKQDVPAATVTTFGLGGPIELLFELNSVTEIASLLAEFASEKIDWKVLGAGSNVLFSDSGIHVPVLRLGKGLNAFALNPDQTLLDWLRDPAANKQGALDPNSNARVFSLAGTSLMSLSRELSQKALAGLEFAAGIPASLGGALVMNSGAHGHSLSEVVRSAALIDREGKLFVRSRDELAFSYRHAFIQPGELVLAVEFELSPGDPVAVREKRNSCLEYRRQTQPLAMPSSGSVFKNPSPVELGQSKIAGSETLSAGALLEKAGLKGKRRGGVGYSELHANWLVRYDESGKTADAVSLIEEGISLVEDSFGIVLKPEMIVWE